MNSLRHLVMSQIREIEEDSIFELKTEEVVVNISKNENTYILKYLYPVKKTVIVMSPSAVLYDIVERSRG